MTMRKPKRKRRHTAGPRSIDEWLAAVQRDPGLDAETKAVMGVAARHAYPTPGGGFAFRDDDAFRADVARTMHYRESWGRP